MLIQWLRIRPGRGVRPVPEERRQPRPAPWRRPTHDPAEVPARVARLQERFGAAIEPILPVFRGDESAWVGRDRIVEVCRWLRDAEQMDLFTDLCGVHTPDRPHLYEVVVHLTSSRSHERIRLKVRLMDGEAMPSITPVWGGANWPEREAYDLVGVPFSGHPNLRRILLPDEFEGHPLHKDFPLKG
jgi:NADH-quinone oxidoreductase subunit C